MPVLAVQERCLPDVGFLQRKDRSVHRLVQLSDLVQAQSADYRMGSGLYPEGWLVYLVRRTDSAEGHRIIPCRSDRRLEARAPLAFQAVG